MRNMYGHFRTPAIAAVTAALIISLAGCGAAGAGGVPKEVLVGTLYASQGPFAVSSVPQYQGLQFWADQVNKDGGAMVKAFNTKIPVRIVSYNDNSTTATASTPKPVRTPRSLVDCMAPRLSIACRRHRPVHITLPRLDTLGLPKVAPKL